ncbi:FG-GAP-like repeat-containing protein [Castellaniella sp.]|uniref:FG-GAP-like repeat-containing protein n=1 Tax=Castellaniella sp. TaxID=1955812 RepID=UPI002AFF9E69|nr:FG-GAP-like repeat-containing protein [Castellaniella sp.]
MFALTSTTASAPLGTSNVSQMKSGDFNGDGNLDFVVSQIDQSLGVKPAQLNIYLGDGTGQFTLATDDIFVSGVPVVSFVARMLVADFNNDGVDDIFAIDSGLDTPPFDPGQNKLFLSRGGKLVDAISQIPQKLLDNHGAAFGDVDNNGTIDILLNALHLDANHILNNGGGGKFSFDNVKLPTIATQNSHTSSGLIDVNGDGWLDMLLGRWDTNSTSSSLLFLNNGMGDFSNSTPIYLPSSPINLEIVLDFKKIDLNGDNLPDLAISVTNGGSFEDFYQIPYVQLLVNKGDGVFVDETSTRFPQNTIPDNTIPDDALNWYLSIDVADINLDGHDDMILDRSISNSTVMLNDGNGKFFPVGDESIGLSAPVYPWGKIVTIGDFNNDGAQDLIEHGWGESGHVFNTYLNQITEPTGLGLIAPYDSEAVYRFFNFETGVHLYSGDRGEIENVLKTMPQFQPEGRAFKKIDQGPDTIDVIRFYNVETGTHFYTANQDEISNIKANYPSFIEEGVAYSAYASQVENTSPLYRFYNVETGTHFYTSSQDEMEQVKVDLAGVMSYEGVAYYIEPI